MTRPARFFSISPSFAAIALSVLLSACGSGDISSISFGSTPFGPGSSLGGQRPNAREVLEPTPVSPASAGSGLPTPFTNGTVPATFPTITPNTPTQTIRSSEPVWSIAELVGLSASDRIKDMNDTGVIVGMTVDPHEIAVLGKIPFQDPFIWKNGQFSSLGSFGDTYGSAKDINSAGQIAGYRYINSIGQTHAFLYENGMMKDIGIFIGSVGSWAEAINESGQVAIYTHTGTYIYSNGIVRAVPGQQFFPAGLNDSGQMAGTLLATGSAAFYDGTTLINLGTLLPTKTYSLATGLNNAGQVIGVGYGTSGIDNQGFVYGAGTLRQLTAPGILQTYPVSINNAGDVVGSMQGADQKWSGFLYHNGTMTDLNALPGVAGSGWVLSSALKITNVGQILVTGNFNGQTRYAVMTPPR